MSNPSTETIRMLSMLYELTLALTEHQDPKKNAKFFLRAVMSKFHCARASIWLCDCFSEEIGACADLVSLRLLESVPHFGDEDLRLDGDDKILELIAGGKPRMLSQSQDLETNLSAKLRPLSFNVIFPLSDIGLLLLGSNTEEFFQPQFITAVAPVMTRFGETLRTQLQRDGLHEALQAERNSLAARVERRTADLQASNQSLQTANETLQDTLQALEQAQNQLIHTEKMASLGRLVASIAHEINNPIAFVASNMYCLATYSEQLTSFATDLQEWARMFVGHRVAPGVISEMIETQMQRHGLDEILADLPDLVSSCQEGVYRIQQIVKDLRNFGHIEDEDWELVEINEVVESSVKVSFVRNAFRHKATLKLDLVDVPQINGTRRRLEQVFINLLLNASQAISNHGQIAISTRFDGERVIAEVSDTGKGIEAENLPNLFEPFFTTKSPGEGMGLGLHVVYTILEQHSATISVQSKPDQGTTFSISFPLPSDETDPMVRFDATSLA